MFSYNTHGQHLSPFLLLDYAGPYTFAPSDTPRGVGQHPHRGFETVTIVYEGEVAHRDSTGAGGTIGPGDVQWMTAPPASSTRNSTRRNSAARRHAGHGPAVGEPAGADKMGAPGYQTLLDAEIPSVDLPDGAGRVRVIAGRFDGHAGPARTHTPMDVWDIRLQQGHHAELPVADGRTLALVVLKGTVRINGGQPVGEAQLVTFDRSGEDVFVDADSDATVLLLSGEPIDEPVVGYGPFVMNSQAEIAQAVNDFNSGRFGQIAH
jgi:redox-sensitive bicupin YhaK (pirin superfamily)